jgi:hypothetical protein
MLLTERNKLNKIETDGKTPFRWIIRNDRLEKFKPKTQSNDRHNKISKASIADGGIINITPLVKQVQTSSLVGIQTQHH